MKKYSLLIVGLLLGFASMMTSCKKDTDETDTSLGSEIGMMESVSNDADCMSGQVLQGSGTVNQRQSAPGTGFGLSTCATVNHDTAANRIVIDFGAGCSGIDGRTRAGRIQIDYTGSYFTPGSSHTVTFDSFYVDQNHIEGTRTVTNRGMNAAGYMYWEVASNNMKFTRPSGYWRSWNGSRLRELIAGGGDLLWDNDTYRVNGTAAGTNSNGDSFSVSFTDLVRSFSCTWITTGRISIYPGNGLTRTLDFGGGNCDDQATFTIGNRTYPITLR